MVFQGGDDGRWTWLWATVEILICIKLKLKCFTPGVQLERRGLVLGINTAPTPTLQHGHSKVGEGESITTGILHISPPVSSWTPGVFYTYFYNHAHRLRLEKLLYLELPRSSNGFFKYFWIQVAVLLLKPPHGGFRSETAVTKPFRK
jgi:hypothetical protein